MANVQNCTSDTSGDGGDGHGNINSGIIGSYNNLSGSPHVDAGGYRIGLGISPYGRVASTKIFNNAGSYSLDKCGWTNESVLERSRMNGASITSNSWGDSAALGDYNTDARDYDVFTRDASGSVAGLQPMLHVFSAGNSGSGAGTVTAPGTAKNVMTVGATENVRDELTADGCGISSANNADDIIYFRPAARPTTGESSRTSWRPAPTCRARPPRAPTMTAGACAGTGSAKTTTIRTAQTLYTWSSGTSHSAPAVAGAAQLAWEYYKRALRAGVTPSPAMVKALLLNSTRYLTGASANDTLPSNNQGWGDANLGMLTDGVPRRLIDQADTGAILGTTGGVYILSSQVSNNTRPVRVTLVWSDAPGPTTGGVALVNDLDLEVTVNGVVYKGNVFSGRNSVTGGSFDRRNTVENVFLPAGTSGPVQVRVIAYNIAGDGVPSNGDATDQDFALVVYNAGDFPGLVATAVQRSITTGDGDVLIDAGETVSVSVTLQNVGSATATGVGGQLSVQSGNVSLINGASGYPDLAAAAEAVNQAPYTFTVNDGVTCGSSIRLQHVVTYNGTQHYTHTLNFLVGAGLSAPVVNYPYTGGATAIPDNSTITLTLPVSQAGPVDDLDVRVNLNHSYDQDLVLTLVSPAGTQVLLSSGNGSNGDNYTDTIFDDEASTVITAGTAPFTGSFRPEGLLATVDGEPATGQWQLRIDDTMNLDTGTLLGWSLDVTGLITGSCDNPTKMYLPNLAAGADQ